MAYPPISVYLDFAYCTSWPYLLTWCSTNREAFLACYYTMFGPQHIKDWEARRGLSHEARRQIKRPVTQYVWQQEPNYSFTHTFIIDRSDRLAYYYVFFDGLWYGIYWPGHSPIYRCNLPYPPVHYLLDSEIWTAPGP